MPSNTPGIPRAVVFDLGKVLVDFDFSRSAAKVAARGTLSAPEVQAFMHSSPLLLRYESGEITTTQFFQEICRKTGFVGTLDEFATFFADVFTPIPEMVQLHAHLKARGFPTFIFSNTNELAVQHIRHCFPFFTQFNGYILSYEHHAMKPDHRLYEVVENMAGETGPAILYLDDILENVESGRQRGWQTIHHQSPETTRRAFQELGLAVKL